MGKLDLILPLIRMKMSKFAPLIKYLEENCSKSTVVTFVDLEQILGFNLPKSAFKKSDWWRNSRCVPNRPWVHAGWEVENVILGDSVTFSKNLNFKKCTNTEYLASRFKDLRTYGCSGFMYLNSKEFYEIMNITLTKDGFFITLYEHNSVRLQFDLEISNFNESIFDFEFEAQDARFLFYKEIDENDDFLDEFDDDDFLDEEALHCQSCGKSINFAGECYCNKNPLSVTVTISDNIYIFNEFCKETIDYLYNYNYKIAIWNVINNNVKYIYFKEIILQDKGFYIEDNWVSINEFLNTTQVIKEVSFQTCDKCLVTTRVYWNETKWLCKPCELALDRKRAGQFE